MKTKTRPDLSRDQKASERQDAGALAPPGIERWVVLPDLQAPYHDKATLAAVEKLMGEYFFHGYLQIGDFLDFDCISSHNKNKLRLVEGKRIHKDYEIAAEILDRHQALIRANNPNAKFVIIEGNHEYRMEAWLDANPAAAGFGMEVPSALEFGRRGITWIPFWSTGKAYRIGKAKFIHGRYTNQYHAAKHAQNYGCNIFYGHTHDIQTYSKEMQGEDNTIVGQSLGCLCRNQSYMQGRPNKWQQAFAVFEFFPDGFFTYNIIRIFRHRFAYNGKIYTP